MPDGNMGDPPTNTDPGNVANPPPAVQSQLYDFLGNQIDRGFAWVTVPDESGRVVATLVSVGDNPSWETDPVYAVTFVMPGALPPAGGTQIGLPSNPTEGQQYIYNPTTGQYIAATSAQAIPNGYVGISTGGAYSGYTVWVPPGHSTSSTLPTVPIVAAVPQPAPPPGGPAPNPPANKPPFTLQVGPGTTITAPDGLVVTLPNGGTVSGLPGGGIHISGGAGTWMTPGGANGSFVDGGGPNLNNGGTVQLPNFPPIYRGPTQPPANQPPGPGVLPIRPPNTQPPSFTEILLNGIHNGAINPDGSLKLRVVVPPGWQQ